MQSSSKSRISKQGINTCKNTVYLWYKSFHLRQYLSHTSHESVISSTLYSVARIRSLTWIVSHKQIHLHISHKVARYFCSSTFRNTQIVVYIKLNYNISITIIIIVYCLYNTYLITISIYRIGFRQALYIVKANIVATVRRENGQTLEEI